MNLIEVQINGLFLTQNQASGIILKEISGDRSLPIIIGEYEAQSIALGLEHIKPPRPITHDLVVKILETVEASVESVVVTELKNNTYYAVIRLMLSGEILEVDSRPSDALAVAARQEVPIYVNDEVLQQAALDSVEMEKGAVSNEEVTQTKAERIMNLKKKLDKAVEKEDYEEAARLRDEIKKVEGLQ